MAQDHKAASENILSGNGDPGLSRAGLYSFALIAVTFLMTSSGYLSWLYHLLTLVPTQTADYLTMCAGYFLQAAGLLVCALLIRRRPSFFNRNMFGAVCAAFIEMEMTAKDILEVVMPHPTVAEIIREAVSQY